MEYLPAVSVIVPIYNVEKYIGCCVRSLFEQTLENMEYIFVNDCTQDSSMEVLKAVIGEYPQRQDQVKVIEFQKNKGVSYARNAGLQASCGLYTIFCDSDDWVEKEMYEKMYLKAKASGADLVGCDYYDEYSGSSCYQKVFFDLPEKEQFRRLLYGGKGGFVWIRLVRRELYEMNAISFPDGVNMIEDLFVSLKLHWKARRVAYIPEAFYHYIKYNSNSIITNINQRQLDDSIEIVHRIESFLKENGIWERYYSEFMELAFLCKMCMVLSPQFQDYARWHSLWPESGNNLLKYHLSFWHKMIFTLVNHKWYMLASALLSVKMFIKKIL